MLLVFITSFGRCWADTYGLLGDSDLACCDPIVVQDDCHHEGDGDHHHEQHEHEEDKQPPLPDPFQTSDCSGCSLVKAGFIFSAVDLDFQAPLFVAIVPEWDDLHLRVLRILSLDLDAQESPPACSQDQAILTTCEIVTTTAISVRGPNLV